jgi:amidase
MMVSTPTTGQIMEIAMQDTVASYRRLDELPELKLPVHVPRIPGYRPGADENLCSGWYLKTEISSGPPGLRDQHWRK